MRVIVGITGASGAIYAKRLLEEFKNRNIDVDLIITKSGEYNIEFELGINSKELELYVTKRWDIFDTAADVASGSQLRDAMIIVPCSMNMVAKIAHGISDNLILRCVDVMLKENRKIIVVPRETPLNENHLENLLKIKKMGVTIIPPMPGFYHKPKSIEDLVDFIVARILDHLNIHHNLIDRWKKPEGVQK